MGVDREPSIEHVIPAGFGPHADVGLPLSAVCVNCNNRLGRQVDEALVHLFEVHIIRGIHRVPEQKGRVLRHIDLRNGRLEFADDGMVHVAVHGEEGVQRKSADTLVVKLVSRRRRSGDQWRRTTRAVLKIGLGLAYYEKGPDFALHGDWHQTRRMIAGEPYRGYLLIAPFDIYARPDLEASLLFDIPGARAVSRLRFGGLELLADLCPGRAGDETRAWAAERQMQVMDIEPQ
jgi:hypothetical protein